MALSKQVTHSQATMALIAHPQSSTFSSFPPISLSHFDFYLLTLALFCVGVLQWVAAIGAHSQSQLATGVRVPDEIRKGVFCLAGRRKKPRTKRQLFQVEVARPASAQEIWAPSDDLLACRIVYNISNR